jgi:hypothetical protein
MDSTDLPLQPYQCRSAAEYRWYWFRMMRGTVPAGFFHYGRTKPLENLDDRITNTEQARWIQAVYDALFPQLELPTSQLAQNKRLLDEICYTSWTVGGGVEIGMAGLFQLGVLTILPADWQMQILPAEVPDDLILGHYHPSIVEEYQRNWDSWLRLEWQDPFPTLPRPLDSERLYLSWQHHQRHTPPTLTDLAPVTTPSSDVPHERGSRFLEILKRPKPSSSASPPPPRDDSRPLVVVSCASLPADCQAIVANTLQNPDKNKMSLITPDTKCYGRLRKPLMQEVAKQAPSAAERSQRMCETLARLATLETTDDYLVAIFAADKKRTRKLRALFHPLLGGDDNLQAELWDKRDRDLCLICPLKIADAKAVPRHGTELWFRFGLAAERGEWAILTKH